MLKSSLRTVPLYKPHPFPAGRRSLFGLALGLCFLGASTQGPPATAQPTPAATGIGVGLGIDEAIIDRSVKPCDDFYRYACGGWLARTQIPADRPTWSRGFSEIHERNQSVLRQILQDAADGKGAPDATTRKLGDFYAACMAEDRIEKTTGA